MSVDDDDDNDDDLLLLTWLVIQLVDKFDIKLYTVSLRSVLPVPYFVAHYYHYFLTIA